MGYGLLADAIVALHVAWVAFVVLGFVAIAVGAWRKWRWVRRWWFRIPHLVCTVIVAVEGATGFLCPLTTWEAELRRKAGEPVDEATFVGRLLHELLFVDVPLPVLNAAYVVFGLVVVGTLLLVPPRRG